MKYQNMVLFGADGYGGIIALAKRALGYGISKVVICINHREFYEPELSDLENSYGENSITVVSMNDNIFCAQRIIEFVNSSCYNLSNSYFVCIYDNLILPYVDALRSLSDETEVYQLDYLPLDAIETARVKSSARKAWSDYDESLTVSCAIHCENGELRPLTIRSDCIFENLEFIVKPIAGAGSIGIEHANNYKEIQNKAASVRDKLSNDITYRYQSFRKGVDLKQDVIVEEKLIGSEYTVDGYIKNGVINFAVQHKELRYSSPFHGDGFVVSPPMHESFHHSGNVEYSPIYNFLRDKIPGSIVIQSDECASNRSEFHNVIQKALRALKLDNWVFHAEVIDTIEHGIKLVELNPRVPGGLLAFSAGIHLGVDLFSALLEIIFDRTPSPILPEEKYVTAHIPLYAADIGVVEEFKEFENICRKSSSVSDYKNVSVGLEVTDTNQENYAGFIVLKENCYRRLRNEAERITNSVEVIYGGRNERK